MKKFQRALCSFFCALNIAIPAQAVTIMEESSASAETLSEQNTEKQDWKISFVRGDFSLHAEGLSGRKDSDKIIFVSSPEGVLVKDAQVITTVIDSFGRQQMAVAPAYRGGYLLNSYQLLSGHYRVETEVVTRGQLLTDEFVFKIS